jgi:hypothetical protein
MKKINSNLELSKTKEDESFHLSDNEKKVKKKKKKAKSKKKEKIKFNMTFNNNNINEEEDDNDDTMIVIGNLILNKKRSKEKKNNFNYKNYTSSGVEKIKKVTFTKDVKNSISDYIKEIMNNPKLSNSKKFGIFICAKIINDICNLFKIIFLFNKIRQYKNIACNKICAMYKAYSFRKKFKFNYLILKIINLRNNSASKIIAYMKGFIIRKNIKKILEKKEECYIIYSTLADNRMLYFKIKYDDNLEDNLYFEYCKVLNCFISFLSYKEKNLSKKIISGFFYNEKYNKLTDDFYKQNEKGENVINFPEIIEKNNKNIDKYDKIINEFMKKNRYKKKIVFGIEEYEENKRKALDDDLILSNKSSSVKLDKMSRSKSYMRLKGLKFNTKSILKPTKSYISLKSEKRKIQFGEPEILGYRLNRKFLS